MKIYTDTPEGVTVVQNSFIDQFMPQANGEFVKVYLYLLRCANSGRNMELSSVADVLEHTEKDILRALSYWEKQELIHMKSGSNGVLQSITFSDLPAEQDKPAAVPQPALPAKTAGMTAPTSSPSRAQKETIQNQADIRQLFFIAEQYLQRPLSSAEQTDFVYYYDTLKFSADLIEYLLEYCISKGSFSRHYMRTVALAWAEAGISTVMQAKQESTLYNRNYFTIMNTFGIKGRNPGKPEMETMSRWFNEYDFTLEIILEACSRTIRQIHQPSFEYANKILKQWHKSGVTSLDDIRTLDLQRTETKQIKTEKKENSSAPKAVNNRFNNFSQREYDYSQLEKQLLNQ